MPNIPLISDDPGTVLDSYDDVAKPVPGLSAASAPLASQSKREGPAERLYQSPVRFAAPRLTICDYSSLDDGEVVYLRSGRTVIGRTTGDITIPLDTIMSAEHAEILRQDAGGALSWVLRDLDSSNGTLVRCRDLTLQSGTVIQIGSRRYRFEGPASLPPPAAGNSSAPHTSLADHLGSAASRSFPALVDCSSGATGDAVRIVITTERARIGRPGCDNEIELDDSCVAPLHAIIESDVTGNWKIHAKPTLNGIWARVKGVKLTHGCLFQCGEQRFKFYMPR
jgi:pSer/pThr/pTyr-binding forkhead associated (FHA) protein